MAGEEREKERGDEERRRGQMGEAGEGEIKRGREGDRGGGACLALGVQRPSQSPGCRSPSPKATPRLPPPPHLLLPRSSQQDEPGPLL